MRRFWGLLAVALPLLAMGALADPAVVSVGPQEAVAAWTFANPGNYTLVNATIAGRVASLARTSGTVGDTLQADFAGAQTLSNLDLTGSPGDVAIANTSQPGPPANVTFQPTPTELEDTFLHHGGGGNTNYGTSSDLWVGYWGNPEWNRAIVRIGTLPIPPNATLADAQLDLYMYASATTENASIAIHRVTTAWLELGATWNDYDGSNPWAAPPGGGDFDAVAMDVVSGITNATGWRTWNITSVVRGWLAGTYPNDGLLLRALGDDARVSTGRKQFFSSDAPNATLRPRFRLAYTGVGSTGLLTSRILDAGGAAAWDRIWWNATVPPNASLAIRTRTGSSPTIDNSWSPWSSPYALTGAAIGAPSGRFVQYEASLNTRTAASPVLHDVYVGYGRYAPAGTVATERFLPPKLAGWGRFEANWSTPVGTAVVTEYSDDDGASWHSAPTGANLTAARPQAIRLRFMLTTDNTTRAPALVPFSLGYSFPAGPDGDGLTLPTVFGVPVWVLLIPFVLLASWILARDLRPSPFSATDLLLIHEDGRLVRRVGDEKSELTDEIAASGMFTLVARFVKDSFGGDGDGGDLKSFQVDEREVAIAKEDYLFLALVGEGTKPRELAENMHRFLRKLERERGAALRGWDGFSSSLGDLDAALRRFLTKGYRRSPLFPRFMTG